MAQDMDLRIIRDAGKAYIRGFYIQQNITQKRMRESKVNQIQQDIAQQEKLLAKSPNYVTLNQNIKILQAQLSTLSSNEMENIKWMK